MDTLLLDTVLWDLCLDAYGNIAVATAPYAIAQDVASACRTFLAEVWYNTSIGVPYMTDILGKFPSLATVKADLVAAALTVPGVTSPVVFITGFTGPQTLTGSASATPPLTILTPTSGGFVKDAAGNIWVMTTDGFAAENGVTNGQSGGTAELTAIQGVIYAQDSGTRIWFTFDGFGWETTNSTTLPMVATTGSTITGSVGRKISGQIQFTAGGTKQVVGF